MAPSLNILLVDDDELVRDSLGMLLEAMGHQPTLADGGAAALALLGEGGCPDLVILDKNMPGLDGLETLARIRALPSQVPILLATGRVDQATLDQVAVHPRVRVTPKPFSLSELTAHIAQVMAD